MSTINNSLVKLLVLCLEGAIISYIWDGLQPTFHWPEITFGQSVGLLIIARILCRPLLKTESEKTLERIENLIFFQIQMQSVSMSTKTKTDESGKPK
jgi:hypothetical protein